jgi:hypothetical protein
MALSHADIEQIVQSLNQAIGAMTQVLDCAQEAQALIAKDVPAFRLFTAAQYTAFGTARELLRTKRDALRAKTVSISDI